MENNEFVEVQQTSFIDYIRIIRYYLTHVIAIALVGIVAGLVYAYISIDIYTSKTQIKISKPRGSILENPISLPDFEGNKSDRFIATEIVQLKSKDFQARVAYTLLDSIKKYNNHLKLYSLLEEPPNKARGRLTPKSVDGIIPVLASRVKIEQMKGVDIIEVEVQSPSPYEAYLIANCYNEVYLQVSQEVNRNQLTLTRNFLSKQREEKGEQLGQAENTLKNYQEQKGFVSLDAQATTLISQLSQVESQVNLAKIELASSNNNIIQLRQELNKADPKVTEYLENTVSEEYIKNAQAEIAKLQLSRDLASIDQSSAAFDPRVEQEYDKKIRELQTKITARIQAIKNVIVERGVDEVKSLSQKLLDEEIKNQSLKLSIGELTKINSIYEKKFNELPRASIEYADLKRKQESLEKLYTLIEQKYQEALVNEQSQPGYISIVESPEKPDKPSKPNRMLIIFAGIAAGLVLGVGYALTRNYFDKTIKSPEEIERKKINLISWIPPIAGLQASSDGAELVVFHTPKATSSEAFKVLRTRLQFSKLKEHTIKSILITSSVPGEGKTTITANLAASFAMSDFKTIIIDADLRKPRMHSLFKKSRTPGLVDYLFDRAALDEVIHKSEMPNLFFVPCGTIPPNPTEILQSRKMRDLFEKLHKEYDYILVDSPPELAVTDAELISQLVDVTVLVALAGVTQVDMVERVVRQFEKNYQGFVGVVLNNFNVDSSYGSYYKYYYYYYGKGGTKRKSIKDKIKSDNSKLLET